MGWTPAEVDAASLWQFMGAWRGWRAANTASGAPQFPSEADHEANLARTLH